MMKLFRCGVCGYVHDGSDAPDHCPKCGSPKEKFSEITGDAKTLIEKSRRTNEYHTAVMSLYQKINKWGKIIEEENLDPNCVAIAKRLQKDSHESIQSIKAELEAHMKKGKWG